MISIIMPVYNCQNYLTGCLDSILNQSFSDFELICIDDGSKDESGRILDEAASKNSKMKVFHISNQGQAHARNLGIEKALGEYVCFVDSDDEVEADYLLKMMNTARRCHADVVLCDMKRVFKKKTNLLEKLFQYYPALEASDDLKPSLHPELLISVINAPYCKLIRRDFLNEHGIGFLEGKIYEDFFFTQTLLMYDPKIATVSEQLYRYHIYQGSTMTSKNSRIHDMYDVMDQLIEAYEMHGLKEKFKDELEYLCIHHICIGTVYRSFMNDSSKIFEELRRAKSYLLKYNFSVNNRYCQNKQMFVRLYLNLFFK